MCLNPVKELFNKACGLLCCLITCLGVIIAVIVVFGIITLINLNPCLKELQTSCLDECIPVIIDLAKAFDGTMTITPAPHTNANNTFLNTRTSPITNADAWNSPSALITWNVWGLAPVVGVVENPADINCTILEIFWNRAFQWREFADTHLQNYSGGSENNSTFFAIAGFQEAFSFGSATCQCITTNQGFIDYQDRLFRAPSSSQVNVSVLYDGWKYRIGTQEAYPQFDGTQTATGSGLMFMSTHEPFSYGFQEFIVESTEFDDVSSSKGLLWAFWKNANGTKGVIAINTHFTTVSAFQASQLAEFSGLILRLCSLFGSSVSSADVYAMGDFNLEPSLAMTTNQVFGNMTYISSGCGPTVFNNGIIDWIFAGTCLQNGVGPVNMTSNWTASVGNLPSWSVGGAVPPNPYVSLADHKLVMTSNSDGISVQ